jgi:hypothetical protein
LPDSWSDLVRPFADVQPSADLLPGILEREAALPGKRRSRPRLPRAAGWALAAVGVGAMLGALALAAHSRGTAREASLAAKGGGATTVTLVGQQGSLGNGHVGAWRTLAHAQVTCGANPSISGVNGNNGVRPSDLCRALAYYPAHTSDSRCSVGMIKGPYVPRRVVITGSIAGTPVHLDMAEVCNPPAKLATTHELIYVAAFGWDNAVKASISESTFRTLTRIAKSEAQGLGDPRVHSAELVLTSRHRMNQGLDYGYQASEQQDDKVFVIQLRGRFTCTECSHPPGASAPTGTAAQDVLSFGSLTPSDFGLTMHPVVMQGMGPVMHLTWR